MGHFIFQGATFCMVVVAASCFELYSTNLDVTLRASKYKCFEEGRFHHPGHCGVYIECVRSTAGTFKRRFGSCHGSMFNETLRHCIEPVEDSDCKTTSRKERSITDDQKFNKLCSSVKNGFVCADCKTAVNCVDGVPYPETCGDGDTCDVRNAFGGAVCYPGQPLTCTCHDKYAFHVDNYNPQVFFYCNEIGAELDMNHCPDGWKFDDHRDQCINDEGLPECEQAGSFALYDNCTEFYTCIYSKTGWVQKQLTCDDGLMLNEDTNLCEDPCTWNTGKFECPSEGRHPDPLSCHHYYECVQQGDGFRQYRRECPSGTVWDDSVLNGQGHCVEDSTVTCNPVSVTKCHLPEGRCSVDPVTPPKLPPPEIPDVTDELEKQILNLREEKALLEKAIEDATFTTTALLETATALGELHSTLILARRTETGSPMELPSITVTPDGNITVSPYCHPDETTLLTLSGTAEQVLGEILFDLRQYITQQPELVPCMNEIIGIFSDVLQEDINLIDDLVSAAANVVEMIDFASNMYKEAEKNLMEAQEQHRQLSSRLQELETQLPSVSPVRSLSGLPVKRFTSLIHRNKPTRTAVKQKVPVLNRWQIMSRGVRRARSLLPSK